MCRRKDATGEMRNRLNSKFVLVTHYSPDICRNGLLSTNGNKTTDKTKVDCYFCMQKLRKK